MTSPELDQIELLAQIDEVTRRLTQWTEADIRWEPLDRCRRLVEHLLKRLATLKIRLEQPIVVATFGGTGTGKSSLVNAIVGVEVTRSGRQRPTTTRPVLIAHPYTELDSLGLPLDDFELVRIESPILRDIVVIDCPDPDTSEIDAPGSNLERVHQLLPHCDVLIYTSTQQKYRSARVGDELGLVATGCRLLFVQTHADLDSDIREDWRQQLEEHYAVPEVFFVDSVRALQEQKAGHRPSGDFARLQDTLTTQLAVSQRGQIRRANIVDLIDAALDRCRQQIAADWPTVQRLEAVLEEQRQKVIGTMADQLQKELETSQNLWERRLVTAVTQIWGFSPFSSVLRFYNGLGSLIASTTLFRARTSAQMALIGAVHGTRWLSARHKEKEAETQLERLSSFGLDDAALRESQLVVSGYVQEAHIDPNLIEQRTIDNLRHEAVRVEDQFLGDASRRIDEIIEHLALRNSGFMTRCIYETLFMVFVLFVLYRIGRNFFYDSLVHALPLISVDFYVPAAIFFVLWSGTLVMLFLRKLRQGLHREIDQLAQDLAHSKISQGLFPHLDRTCRDIHRQRERLDAAASATSDLRMRIAIAPGLGAPLVETADAH